MSVAAAGAPPSVWTTRGTIAVSLVSSVLAALATYTFTIASELSVSEVWPVTFVTLVAWSLASAAAWLATRVAISRRATATMWRDALFRAFGWCVAMSLAWLVTSGLMQVLYVHLYDTPLEALSRVVGTLAGLTVFTLLVVAFHLTPRALMRLRLAGRVEADVSADVLYLGAGWILIFSGATLVDFFGAATATMQDLSSFFMVGLAAIVAYAAPRLWLSTRPASRRGLWVVLTGSVDSSLPTRAIDILTRYWQAGPVTLVLPAGVALYTEHARIADACGRLKALFPKLEVEIGDWPSVIPPSEHWSAVVVREMHPIPELMLAAVRQHLTATDSVVLLASKSDGLPAWQQVLRSVPFAIGWVGEEKPPDPMASGAHRCTVLSGKGSALKQQCVQLSASLGREETASEQRPAPPTDSRESATVPPESSARTATATPRPERQDVVQEAAPTERAPVTESASQGEESVGAAASVPGQESPDAMPPPAGESKVEAATPDVPARAPRVFISYCSEYRAYVEILVRELEHAGVEVQYDGRLKAGDDWVAELTRMLDGSDALVAVVGSVTAGRTSPLAEIRRATEQGKRVLPVFVDTAAEPKDLFQYFAANADPSGIQYLAGLDSTALEKVLNAAARRIAEALAPKSADQAAPAARAVDEGGESPEQVAQGILDRGIGHHERRDYDGAIADFTQVIELKGASPGQIAEALIGRGSTYQERGEIDTAIADYTRAIELPGVPPERIAAALHKRGRAHYNNGRGAVAAFLNDIQAAVNLSAAPATLANLGLALLFSGRDSEGAEAYRRFVASTPSRADLSAARADLKAAMKTWLTEERATSALTLLRDTRTRK